MSATKENGDKQPPLITLINHANLASTSMSTNISRKWTEENVAVTTFQSTRHDEGESRRHYCHSSIDYKPNNAVTHTFCPSPELAGEPDLERSFLPRVHANDLDMPNVNEVIPMLMEDDGVLQQTESPPVQHITNQAVPGPVAHSVPRYRQHDIPLATTIRRSRLGWKRKEAETKRSETKLFEDALADYSNDLNKLFTQWNRSPLRVCHFFENKRCFAYASAHIVHRNGQDRTSYPVLSILWQTCESPRRAVVINFSIHPSTSRLRATCTCETLRSATREDESSCEHLKVCYGNELLVSRIKKALQDQRNVIREQNRSTAIFGEPVPIVAGSESILYPSVSLRRVSITSYERGSQLEGRRKVRKDWTFWMVFDSDSLNFVPVLKVKGKPFNCFACRLEYGTRGMCNHELACFQTRKYVGARALHDNIPIARRPEGNEPPVVQEEATDSDTCTESSAQDDVEEVQHQESENRERYLLYYTNKARRTVLPCPSDVDATRNLSLVIETLTSSEVPSIHEVGFAKCHRCGELNVNKPEPHHRRKVKLFTLSQGTVTTHLYDWYCHTCHEKRLFSGEFHGIFPARKFACYTTELLYTWSQMVCLNGSSFRDAYKDARLVGRGESTLQRFRKLGRDNHASDKKTSRTRANEAFRQFLKTVKTDCSQFTRTAFSCVDCEVPLTVEDCAQLNIDPQRAADMGLKRFKAIVIDGTAAGVLTKLPNYQREFSTLKASRNISSKLVGSAVHQKTLMSLFQMCTQTARKFRKSKRSMFGPSRISNLRFWLCNPPKTRSDIFTPKTKMNLTQARNAMMMSDENACFCVTVNGEHSEECGTLVSNFNSPNELVTEILHSIFKVSCEPPFQSVTEGQETVQPPQHQSTQQPSESHGQSDADNEGNTEGDTDYEIEDEEEEKNDSDEEEGQQDENDVDAEVMEENTERGTEGSTGQATEEGSAATSNNNRERNAAATRQENGEQPDRKSIWATLLVPDIARNGELTETLMALLRFTLIEHVAMPYMTWIPYDVAEDLPIGAVCTSNQDNGLLARASRSINLHKKVILSLKGYTSCDRHHEGSEEPPWSTCPCVEELKKWTMLLQDANPVLEKFCIQLTMVRRPLHRQVKQILEKLCLLLEAHADKAVSVLHKFERKIPSESKEYWERCNFNENILETAQPDDEFVWNEVGMCFPGRSRCRPGIIFDIKESQHCTKKYPKSQTHSPGILTAQCTCGSPKLVGFIIMTRAESTALALSAILMYFQVPPRIVYYDNACNMFTSIFLRIPWLLSRTTVAVDRFHYKSHTCSAFFSPDSYQALDRQRTETAESFNARIQRTLYHMRYLSWENLIPFLFNRIAQLNIAALFKQKYSRPDLEEEDLAAFFREIYHCECRECNRMRDLQQQLQTANAGDDEAQDSTAVEQSAVEEARPAVEE